MAMNPYAIIFYVLSAVIAAATGLAVTRRELVHAVVYLILSFFGTALMFYLLAAPFLAALEVIIYAGAIMVLFLFVIMMMHGTRRAGPLFALRQWLPAVLLGAVLAVLTAALLMRDPGAKAMLPIARVQPQTFGFYLFRRHYLAIEIVSLLLLVVLVGALVLGRRPETEKTSSSGGQP